MRLINHANNFHEVAHRGISIYFSYETPIAIVGLPGLAILSHNEWGPTSGKHINKVKEIVGDYVQVTNDTLKSTIETGDIYE